MRYIVVTRSTFFDLTTFDIFVIKKFFVHHLQPFFLFLPLSFPSTVPHLLPTNVSTTDDKSLPKFISRRNYFEEKRSKEAKGRSRQIWNRRGQRIPLSEEGYIKKRRRKIERRAASGRWNITQMWLNKNAKDVFKRGSTAKLTIRILRGDGPLVPTTPYHKKVVLEEHFGGQVKLFTCRSGFESSLSTRLTEEAWYQLINCFTQYVDFLERSK